MSQFEYVAVLISIIVGLALTQILRGVGRMVTAKEAPRPYWVHLLWTFYLFFVIALFWWWEFQLSESNWSLPLYLVVIVYATLLFFLSLVVQPVNLEGVVDYREYFYAHRRWIFGLLMATVLWDFVDTLVKGIDHFRGLGTEYVVFQTAVVIGSAIAMATRNERYHEVFAICWVASFVALQFRNFFVIN